jgi:hypothetical protein
MPESDKATETSMVFFEIAADGLSNAEFLDEMLRAEARMDKCGGRFALATGVLDLQVERRPRSEP